MIKNNKNKKNDKNNWKPITELVIIIIIPYNNSSK